MIIVMYQKTLTLVLAIAALFCMSYGITGFATIDGYDACVQDSGCKYSVCCPIYDKDYGVCAQQTECSQIYFDSMNDVQKPMMTPEVGEQAERSYIAVVLGILILLILAIVGYFEWKHERVEKIVNRIRKSKK